jgi:importin subunit beta-1
LTTLAQASQAQVDRNDFDMIDYLNELREGVLDAYTGIIQGLKGDGPTPNPDVMILEPQIPFIVQFITVVAQDTVHSDATVAVAGGISRRFVYGFRCASLAAAGLGTHQRNVGAR